MSQARSRGVGGSDAAAILGLSPWKTAFEVWQEKLGLSKGKPDNPAMAYGRLIEPVIRQWYSDETGRVVTVPNAPIFHPKYPYILGSLDGIADGERVLEIKTSRSSDGWGEPGTDQIPVYYQTQVQQYMMVTGFDVADVAVSVMGSIPVLYEVGSDMELQEMMIEAISEFWDLVQKQIPPELVTYNDMIARFGKKAVTKPVTASSEAENALLRIKEISGLVRELEEEEEALKAILMGSMGDFDTLVGVDGKVLCTWKLAKPSVTFDSEAFKESEPELYAQYLRTREPSRRFLLKG